MSSNTSPTRSSSKFAQFKLVLLGESAVGKSSIVHRFVKNTFDNMRESTIGAAFLTQSITLPEINTTVKFEIWDTAGQERYKSLAPMYYRNANAALCVYDITSSTSFSKAQDWVLELKKQALGNIVICLVGNKSDLEDQREVLETEITEYVETLKGEEFNIITAECSAKTGDGVHELFEKIARALPVEDAVSGSANRYRQGSRRNQGIDLSNGPRALLVQSSTCC